MFAGIKGIAQPDARLIDAKHGLNGLANFAQVGFYFLSRARHDLRQG
jgi:hypothetical protein